MPKDNIPHYKVSVAVTLSAPDQTVSYTSYVPIAKVEQHGETKVLMEVPAIAKTVADAALAQCGIAVQAQEAIEEAAKPELPEAAEPVVE